MCNKLIFCYFSQSKVCLTPPLKRKDLLNFWLANIIDILSQISIKCHLFFSYSHWEIALIFISLLSWINSSIENRNPKISDRFSFLQKWIVKQLIPPKFAHTTCPILDPKKPTPPKNERSFNKWEHVWTSLIKKQNNLRIAANKLTKCTTTTLQNSICVCNSTLWYEWRFKNAFYVLVSHVFIWSSSLTNKYILQFSSRLTEIIKPPYVSIFYEKFLRFRNEYGLFTTSRKNLWIFEFSCLFVLDKILQI